ncbi:MAG: hypothetical protein QMC96_05265 [Methanomicrobiales archaeon]|nr:hypothetical protein [Methanomicrobiales archaeon]
MDTGMRNSGREALKRIFEAAHFTVEELADPLALSASSDQMCLVAMFSDDLKEMEQFDRTNFRLEEGERTLVCRKLLFSLAEGAKADTCILWDRDDFVRYAGAAALAAILGQRLVIDLEPSADQQRTEERGRISAIPEEGEKGPEVLHLPVRVDAGRALRIAGIEGEPTLRFIPHWRYRVVSDGEKPFRDRVISFKSEERGAVNAINGMRIEMPLDTAEMSAIPADAELVGPRSRKEDVEESIINALTERLTQRIRIKTEKGDAIFYEDKAFKPERRDIRIDTEMVYVPVWQIRGKKIVEVNGFNGEILSLPMDEGVEVL